MLLSFRYRTVSYERHFVASVTTAKPILLTITLGSNSGWPDVDST